MIRILFSLFFILFALFTACTTLSTERFIESAEFSGASKEHMVRITKNVEEGQVTLRPKISISPETDYRMNTGNHPRVNSQGVFQLIYDEERNVYLEKDGVNTHRFEGENFSWKSPKAIYSMEIEFKPTKNIALYTGADMSEYQSKQFWGTWFGAGFMTESEFIGFRGDVNFDFRNNFQEIKYYVKESRLDHYDWFSPVYDEFYILYEDKGKVESNQLTFAITMNTKYESLLNGFCSFAFDKITFIDYTNYDNGGFVDHNEEYEFSQDRTHFMFGLYHDLANFRILFGTDFTRTISGEMRYVGHSEWTNSYFIQMEIIL